MSNFTYHVHPWHPENQKPFFFFFFCNSADKGAPAGKKSARKTTRAGGSGIDLQKVAEEQQIKLEKEREERKEQIKAAKEAAAAENPPEVTKEPEPSKYGGCTIGKTGCWVCK